MKRLFKILLFIIVVVVIVLVLTTVFLTRSVRQADHITWGVDFSQVQAESLKIDWKKNYLAILEDLGAKHVKLHTQWNWVEGERGIFYFQDIDWQLEQAAKHQADIIYVVGMKTGRWPECHVPDWAALLGKKEQQEKILAYIETVVNRYKGNSGIVAWQAENEPLFVFGQCPWYDKQFLAREVALIQSLDRTRPVIVSDSGEQSLWWQAAGVGDIVGTTLYRTVWVHITNQYGFYIHFPLPASSYYWRAQIVKALFKKKVINIELQTEPWVNGTFTDIPLADQEKTMNLAQFKKNITYAKQTGLDTFYLWGVEWQFWMKEEHNQPEIWNEAKKLFKN